jgi:DNA-binding NtrC family response regulator
VREMSDVVVLTGKARYALLKAMRDLGYEGTLEGFELAFAADGGEPAAGPDWVGRRAAEVLEHAYDTDDDDLTLYRFVLSSVEKPLIESVLRRTGGNQVAAARLLGINRNTLRARIRRLGVELPQICEH